MHLVKGSERENLFRGSSWTSLFSFLPLSVTHTHTRTHTHTHTYTHTHSYPGSLCHPPPLPAAPAFPSSRPLSSALLPLSPFHSVDFPRTVRALAPSSCPPASVVAAVMSPRFTKQAALHYYQVDKVMNLKFVDTAANGERRWFENRPVRRSSRPVSQSICGSIGRPVLLRRDKWWKLQLISVFSRPGMLKITRLPILNSHWTCKSCGQWVIQSISQ